MMFQRSSLVFRSLCTILLVLCTSHIGAQTCKPSVTYTLASGEITSELSGAQSAPLFGEYLANPKDLGTRSAVYEWRVFQQSVSMTEPIVHRYEENFDYTFEHSGTYHVKLYAWFIQGNDTIIYPEEGEENAFVVEISESELEIPNAFSPNGDGTNDEFKVIKHKSIISFKATIFNRWGQKLYSWNDVNGSWDGKYNGKTVKDGVYYINITAKGADGHVFNIRRDINVLTSLIKDE